MKHKYIPLIILFVLFIVSLFVRQPQRLKVQGDPNDLVLKPEIRKDAIVEIGYIDPGVNQQLQTLLDEGGLPSFTVGIVVDDELVWAKSYGGHAGIDTVYMIGSVTKSFIATAVLQLYEQGLIDLDSDVTKYLPFPVRHPEYPDTPITVRMLLTNQAGLAYGTDNLASFQTPDDVIYQHAKATIGLDLPEINMTPHPTRDAFFEEYLTPGGKYYTKDIWGPEPGTYLYSNIGFGLLAYLIECVTEGSFESYLRKNIFEPLDMDLSGAELAGLELVHAFPNLRVQGDYIRINYQDIPIRRFCKPFQIACIFKNLTNPGGYFPAPAGVDQILENGYLRFPLYDIKVCGGGLRSNVPNLANFMIAHMNEGRAPNGYQLLQPETTRLMHQVAATVDGSINMIPMIGYGMGWTLAEDGIQGHIGGEFGYESEVLYKETHQGSYGIIFLRNWSWDLADDYDNGFEYWKKYHVGVREILMAEAERLLP